MTARTGRPGRARRAGRALAVAAASVALLAGGCGVSGSNGGGYPGSVAQAYFRDVSDQRFSDACKLLTDGLRAELGDCPKRVAALRDELPVDERIELGQISVRGVKYPDKNTATIRTADMTALQTVTVRVNRTPTPKWSWVKSLAAYHMTNGHGMTLIKVGKDWLISKAM